MQPRAIGDERLHIRPLANTDIEPIYLACQDPEVQRWTVAVPVPYARSDAEWFVNEHVPTAWEEDREYTWAIAEPDGDALIGVISLRNPGAGLADVGYWLAPEARGRGAATRALAGVCRFGFEQAGQRAIRWTAIVGNEASRRVAERVGFQTSTPVRSLLDRRGERVDGWIGTLLPGDPPLPAPAVLTDGVVTLRGPQGADLAALPELVDEHVLAWTGVPSRSLEDLRPWLDVARRPSRPPAARFAITDGSGRLHGFIRLSQEPMSESTSVGWWLGPAARGQGLAYRAVRLALEWAAGQGAVRFAAGIFDGNAASIALAERLGMRSEGLRRAYWPPRKPGDPRRDTWLYALVPGDPGWPATVRRAG